MILWSQAQAKLQSLKLLVTQLKLQLSNLQDELEEARNAAVRSLFWLDNIKEKSDLLRFYTGLHYTTSLFWESAWVWCKGDKTVG